MVSEFWNWFGKQADAIASEPENSGLLGELDRRVSALDSRLSWEIGPGLAKPWQLVLSPNLDRELRKFASSVVSAAPALEQWEFYAARQPKDWDYRVDLYRDDRAENISVDASNWTFVLLKYPDGIREILMKASGLPDMNDDDRRQAAAITLVSILGEDVVMDVIDEFDLVDELEPRFAERERPIQELRPAVMGG